MSNSAWVCFECRSAVRRPTQFAGDVPCPTCGAACTPLGYKIPVPPKSKAREWQALREQLHRERDERMSDARAARIRRRHDLEQEIARLDALPSNPGRTRAIALLRKQLRDLGRD